MDALVNLAHGFLASAAPVNLLFCLLGALLGTLIGVLPGIGPITTIALLLPLTLSLEPLTALIMLAGIYYGAQYGGSTTAILINLPGEATSVITAVDGYQMARQGRAGHALAAAATGSFFAGCVGTLLIALFGPMLSGFAQRFSAPEYAALMILGLVSVVVLAHGSIPKAIAMVLAGLLLGFVGTDVNSGTLRYTFGIPELSDGIGFVPIAMGLFGIGEILTNLERPPVKRTGIAKVESLLPDRAVMAQAFPAMIRGTLVGSILGILPGGGAILGSFASYTLEKRLAADPSRFGKGAIEGVAAPEAANNAAAQTSFIPLLTLGLPSNAVMALMMGAMIIHGIAPGSAVMTQKPELFWGMVASMLIGNFMLLVINLPLIGIWVKLLSVPYRLLFPGVVLCCCLGAYSITSNVMDIWLTIIFGVAGYFLRKLGYEASPLILGLILGPMFEENIRRSMLLADGNPLVFFTRPISGTIMAIAVMFLVLAFSPKAQIQRETVFKE